MEMEKERGISISSTVMNFDYNSLRINILDTPGHQDFSEDTYRALAAADNAVMLLDAAKGLEPQTRKLFEVCRMRNLPLFTFVNKMDRPALTPYEIMDQIEEEFGLETHPILWPIGDGDRFKGVLDRLSDIVHLYQVRVGNFFVVERFINHFASNYEVHKTLFLIPNCCMYLLIRNLRKEGARQR